MVSGTCRESPHVECVLAVRVADPSVITFKLALKAYGGSLSDVMLSLQFELSHDVDHANPNTHHPGSRL